MSTEDPTLEEVLLDIFDERLSQLHTAMPGRVESYDPLTQTASVKPMLKLDGRTLPVLPRVPIVFMRAGGFYLVAPLSKGDFVLLVATSSSIAEWRATDGREADPVDKRRHHLSSCVAIPGLYPNLRPVSPTDVSPDAKATAGVEGGVRVLFEDDAMIVASTLVAAAAAGPVALAEATAAELNKIRTKYNGHTHPVSTTGTAAAQAGTAAVVIPADQIAAIGDVASTTLKAE